MHHPFVKSFTIVAVVAAAASLAGCASAPSAIGQSEGTLQNHS